MVVNQNSAERRKANNYSQKLTTATGEDKIIGTKVAYDNYMLSQ